ncbi:Polypeptide N-acetylgalactosaminyltransferase 10 [Portunus trituberculatus]|uniref:Polypeptide N-acetylgalactosaminyltransferase 10 n=1 Tax=Portunus trituberculatus TaxID=210409 RepID=A0A5B7JP79_PORTR|nr:Polypeptide N-acetylgalactosaminyltransferase 10 [Portunus trituberculatus]
MCIIPCIYLLQNYKRVAVVWMGEYAEALYKKNPRLRDVDPGDVSKEIAVSLGKKKKCYIRFQSSMLR